eukprot:TRINITY_DN32426_c0_g1_i1.p1 TRINITY_DN32426_c0_g1~~TRINITY_DN32426_c0_g1_i1.p1  ORF type:complete len:516 (+),score=116.03 TRINITY_DN32426_c0_g1_i1:67-1548(+)
MAERVDAVVVGGGAAGIAAARHFAALRHSCVVLEARGRAGGRAHCSDELGCGIPLDHGAQWIHGTSPDHPMLKLARGLGIKQARRPSGGCCAITVMSDGRPALPADSEAARAAYSRAMAAAREACNFGVDKSYADALGARDAASTPAAFARFLPQPVNPDQAALLNDRIYHHCENYEGARLDRWSVQEGGRATCLPGPNSSLEGGYGGLVAALARGLDMRLGHRVAEVRSDGASGGVAVRCVVSADSEQGGERELTFEASCCVVAVPLGVLRSGSVRFVPQLPPRQLSAIAALGISVMDKVELRWEKRWWPPEVGCITVASHESTPVRHPWPWFLQPIAPGAQAVLVCFVTGQFAEEVEGMADADVAAACAAALRRAMPACEVPEPAGVHVTRWLRDPYSQGSWTYYQAGSSPDDVTALRQPVGSTGCVAFAGEHTCDGSVGGLDIGTVHGAWRSGELAAEGLVRRCCRAAGGGPAAGRRRSSGTDGDPPRWR